MLHEDWLIFNAMSVGFLLLPTWYRSEPWQCLCNASVGSEATIIFIDNCVLLNDAGHIKFHLFAETISEQMTTGMT